jgi:Ni,Fe-hydrogenase III large subunit
MVRQCAWCLHLINNAGERLSPLPLPKLYEASHGICGICGVQWMEQVIEAERPLGILRRQEAEALRGSFLEVERLESINQMVVQLQEQSSEVPARFRRSTKVRLV